MARILFVLYLLGSVYASLLALGMWSRGAEPAAWNGWLVAALMMIGRAMTWGEKQ